MSYVLYRQTMSIHLYIALDPRLPGLDPNGRDRPLFATRICDGLTGV